LPNPLLVVAPTAVTVQSGAAFNIDNGAGYLAADSASRRLFVSWTASTDPFVRDYIVQFKKSTDADYVTYAVKWRIIWLTSDVNGLDHLLSLVVGC
jgi:hypothetical protein